MKTRFAASVLLFGTFLQLFLLSAVSQTDDAGTYLSIDQVTARLEQDHQVKLFYKYEWFEKRNFHSSILTMPFNEALDRIASAAGLSVVTIDSVLYVLVPAQPIPGPAASQQSPDLIIVGNPDEYGKYSTAIIHGKILDGKNGSPLPGASVVIDKIKKGTIADASGNYYLRAPVGEHTIRLSFMGFEDNSQKIKLVSDGTLNMELFEKTVNLDEVIISSERAESNVTGTQMSIVKLDSRAIRELPATLGETDIIKSISLMPGVQTVGEFGTGFNVRGGGADQNLILLEDVPLFNASHLFGLISVVNSDGVTNVTLLKAGIPAKYGERASSVMEIEMGAGDQNKTSVKGGIGLINSRIHLETPLFNKKITLLLGARSSYSNWLLHSIPDIDLMNSSARFYDANALLSLTPNSTNKISIFAYLSNDQFGLAKNTDYKYSNLLGSVRWKHTFGDGLFFNLIAGSSTYRYQVAESDTSRPWEDYRINSSLMYKNMKWNFTWFPGETHVIDFGVNTAFYTIKPGDLTATNPETIIDPVRIQPERGGEYALYFTDNITVSPKLTLDLGVRYSLYSYLKPISWYNGLEPRLALRIITSENSSVKLSYNRIHQYVNLVSNTAVMTPADVWKLSSPGLKPLTSDHVALGYYHNFKENTVETSVEIYYKNLDNAIDYKNGAKILLNPYLESDLINAKGKSYGIEFYVRKNAGRFTGWASYTFSRTFHKSDGISEEETINSNRYYPTSFDKPDNMIINASYHISRRWRFGSTFTYSTGRPVTLPELKYSYSDYELQYYSDRNKYRLPVYHRLDLSITLDESLRIRKKWKGSWTFSIVNLYGRKNAYSVFYKKEDHLASNEFKHYDTYKLYIIGRPLPTLSYNFTF